VEPLKETREALRLVRDDTREGAQGQLLAALLSMGEVARSVVPDCVGLSLGLVQGGLTFTLVASDLDTAALDAAQYLDGGPCLRDERDTEPRIARMDDAADRRDWEWYVRAATARGVASSLSLPVVRAGRVIGAINLYASAPHSFDGHVEELAQRLGADAAAAATDADLSFGSRRAAASTPARLQERQDIDHALGMLAARHAVSLDGARSRLARAAERAGVSEAFVARMVVDLYAGRP
jgi:GAF domain-containing protein